MPQGLPGMASHAKPGLTGTNPALPLFALISSLQSPGSSGEYTLSLSPLQTDPSPVTQRGRLFGFAGATGKPRSSPLEPWAGERVCTPTQSKQHSQSTGKKKKLRKGKTKARERARGVRMKMLK